MKYLISPFKAKNENGSVWVRKGLEEKWTRVWGTYAETITLISQRFGENLVPLYAELGLKGHNGNDWKLPNNTCLYAVHDGTIVETRESGDGYGAYVRIEYKHKTTTQHYVYGHLFRPLVNVGQKVRAGELIALSDNTGNSTGPHLHSGRRFMNLNGTVKNYNNGYWGYTDEYVNYYETDIPKTDDLKNLREYFRQTGIWPWRTKNWLGALEVLNLSGHTRSHYLRYIMKH